jgi:fermentation-respiration switch protein FrsA (DUF1100 family)
VHDQDGTRGRFQPDMGEQDSLDWLDTARRRIAEGEWAIELDTDRSGPTAGVYTGDARIEARYHPALEAPVDVHAGAIWVGGAGGGLDGPAGGLYPAACRRLQQVGVAGLRIHYRYPNELMECVLDTLLGVEFLAAEGIRSVALVGHSFGGAVVITAGAIDERVEAVVAMSTQTHDTDLARHLSPRPLLLVHGTNDQILPDACSRQVYSRASEPKQLQLYEGAGHGLDEVRVELLDLLEGWIVEKLLAAETAGLELSDRR